MTENDAAPENAPQPKKSPLQLLKERQAQQRQNLAAKGTGNPATAPDTETANAHSGGGKKMRSSASKQGG